MTQGKSSRTTIIRDIEFEKPASFDDFLGGLLVTDDPNQIGLKQIKGLQSDLTSRNPLRMNLKDLENQFTAAPTVDFAIPHISQFRVAFLDASSRLYLAQSTQSHNPHVEMPQNPLQSLFAKPEKEEKLRQAFLDTFGMDIKLDYSGMTRLMLRVAKEFEEIPKDPRDAYPIVSKYKQLDQQGDGFRSFVGVVLSLLLSEERVILLDEPEAFLHPAQAKRLGKWIADYSKDISGQIIVATHNANFLSGILSSDQGVDIYRLNRTDDNTVYRRITSEATSKLAKSPLLSSQPVLESIFYSGVGVCEADTDRILYQAVALREFDNHRVLFVHAHNKQTVKDVLNLLVEATIPVCAIVDIDIMNSEEDLRNILLALKQNLSSEALEMRKKVAMVVEGTPDEMLVGALRDPIAQFLHELDEKKHTPSSARSVLRQAYRKLSKWAHVKRHGLVGVPEQERSTAAKLIERAKEFGLFIVPVGELEGWINVGTTQKNKWIVKALQALDQGQCTPNLRNFVKDILGYLDRNASQK